MSKNNSNLNQELDWIQLHCKPGRTPKLPLAAGLTKEMGYQQLLLQTDWKAHPAKNQHNILCTAGMSCMHNHAGL